MALISIRYSGEVILVTSTMVEAGSGDWRYSRRTLCGRVALRAAGRQIGLRAARPGPLPLAPRRPYGWQPQPAHQSVRTHLGLSAPNKRLAKINKSRTGGEATKNWNLQRTGSDGAAPFLHKSAR
jgi:hypothetical protein